MRRVMVGSLLAVCVATVCPTADAGWHEFWHRFKLDFHRNNAWPTPFVEADRHSVQQHWELMTNNGWRMQNTLTPQLFDNETQQITQAGRHKIHWILTRAPAHRRTVFVMRGHSDEVTSIRITSVEKALNSLQRTGPRPEVLVTDVIPRNGSGAYYDRISREYESSSPAPRLPAGGEGG